MSVYNDAPFVAQAIESILAQSLGDFEFLIVDDGSDDGSAAVIDAQAAHDPRIRVIRQENHGLIFSLNRAVAEARGAWIARMDSDDIALPERFARQMAYLDANPDCAVLGTNFHNIDSAGKISRSNDLHPLDHDALVAAMTDSSPICHPTVMMQRQAVLDAGGYRKAYRHCEDFDLWLRLSQHVRFANLPDRLLLYRRSGSQISVSQSLPQRIGAGIALLAHEERLAGRPDPTDGLEKLPPVEQLDTLFGRPGTAARLQAQLAHGLVYSPAALRDGGLDIILSYLRDGGSHAGFWRTVLRMIAQRQWMVAGRLALCLLRSRSSS